MSKTRKTEYKILSFSTTMRNPERIANFLKALLPFENRILSHEIIMQIIAYLIAHKLYVPLYASKNYKEILESDEIFSQAQTQEIIENSPQNHKEAGFNKGWDSRFDTFYKLSMEFGFCFYTMNEPLIISNTGHLLIDAMNENPGNEAKIANIFLNGLMKYQSNNPFRNTKNANVPLILLLNTMGELKNLGGDSKIHRSEITFFLCWKDSNFKTLAKFILDFRKAYPHFAYSDEIIYHKCLKLLESKNTKRFKLSQVCGESVDEYIRKMRITGIISLRGNGRFLDFNSFEMDKIKYVRQNYSTYPSFKDKKAYFVYMGKLDTYILEIGEVQSTINKEALKLRTLQSFASKYSKEQIYKELHILNSKKTSSKDEVFKFIPEPMRFEFLTAIALKQHFESLQVLPNYSIDDEGLPKSFASGNQADILCKDKESEATIEVSLICGRGQVNNELLPIARHLRELTESSKDKAKIFFALFIAPKIFEDSKRYVKFIAFDEGLNIKNFDILEFIEKLKISHKTLLNFNEAFEN